ncbi:hypothetical protein EBR44_12670 [bacterium]|jgi:hypothetical protein|nr:hypothetical protein [bacterium]
MMHECDNGEIRDVLPEYMHGRHDAVTRARVEAHLAACLVCTEELAFLRGARHAFPTPVVNVDAIVRGLASNTSVESRAVTASARPRRLSQWAIAAGVSCVLVGGASVQLLRTRPPAPVEQRPVVNVSDSGVPAAAAERGWSDLSYDQLKQLLESIDGADPVPSLEPTARTSPIIVPAGAAGHTGGG